MEGPFVCYRELIAPTNISLATFFTCTSKSENESSMSSQEYLWTGTISTISIYKIQRNLSQSHLSLCAQYQLFGKLQDIQIFSPKFLENFKENNYLSSQLIFLSLDIAKFVIFAMKAFLLSIIQNLPCLSSILLTRITILPWIW